MRLLFKCLTHVARMMDFAKMKDCLWLKCLIVYIQKDCERGSVLGHTMMKKQKQSNAKKTEENIVHNAFLQAFHSSFTPIALHIGSEFSI